MNEVLILRVKKLHPDATLPTKAYEHALGYDLYACESRVINEHATEVDTGIAIEFPKGYGAIIRDRSSLALRGFKVSGGVIDEDYRGGILVILTCKNLIAVNKGDKIAQLILIHTVDFPVQEVFELSPSQRGERGFGSSDSKLTGLKHLQEGNFI